MVDYNPVEVHTGTLETQQCCCGVPVTDFYDIQNMLRVTFEI